VIIVLIIAFCLGALAGERIAVTTTKGNKPYIASQKESIQAPDGVVAQDTNLLLLRANHAPTWLDIRIPECLWHEGDTNNSGLQLDQWEIMHPSVVFIPEGFLGYRYWFAGTYLGQGGTYENPCIYVSNDNINWTEVIVGDDTLHNPIFTREDFAVTYLSDCELFMSHTGELWLFFRGKTQTIGCCSDTNFIFGVYTTNGVDWHGKNEAYAPASKADTIVGPVTGADCLSHHGNNVRAAQGFDLLSPAVVLDPVGQYRMWTVETGIYLPVCNPGDTQWVNEHNFVTLWEADNPEGPWDTVQTCNWLPSDPSSRDIWHLSVLPYDANNYLTLVTETRIGAHGSPAWLHIAISTDTGKSFTTRADPLLKASTCAHWANELIYRSCGIWIDSKEQEHTLGLYYSAYGGRGDDTLDNRVRWATGYTECYYEGPCQNRGNVDGITSIGGPIDVADLTYLVNYLFQCGYLPPCVEEGNIDGSSGQGGPIDVADLTYLVNYLFNSGDTPPPCP